MTGKGSTALAGTGAGVGTAEGFSDIATLKPLAALIRLERRKRRLRAYRSRSARHTIRNRSWRRNPGLRRSALSSRLASISGNRELAENFLYRQQTPQMDQLQQPQLKVEPLLLPISQFIEGSQHHLEKARQLLFAEEGSRSSSASLLVRRNLQ